MSVKYWVMLLGISLSSGCVSIATYFVTDSACQRSNVHCGRTDTDETNAAIDSAIYASNADRVIYNKIKEELAAEPDSGHARHAATEEETCQAGLIRVCSAVRGCFCEPQDKTDTD